MKFIKNELRSRMNDEFLSGCMVSFVEKDLFNNVSTVDIILKKVGTIEAIQSNLSNSDAKRANLSARKKERIELPKHDSIGGDNKSLHISEFLSHKSGIEAMLNKRALQSFESIDSNIYRCTLPQVQLLNFEVAPVLTLQVNPTSEDCIVKMLSCKFEGSDLVEQQNEHFSASMVNCITWDTVGSHPFLDVDVKLNISLEIYTMPFTMLPTSAVETPETPFTVLAPPVFKGEGYHVWAARMEAHMEANDLWEAVEEDYEVPPLPENPTMAQMRNYTEKKTRKIKG
ncbi:hypothetical protein FXO37_32796 [Capsicum annuum]|nr:hypothetical protein FXO37_32796 [Capsicum annuum]